MFSSFLVLILKTSFWTLQKRGRRVLKCIFCKVWWSWWAYWADSKTPVAVTLRIDLLQDCGPSSGHLDGRVEHLQANPLDDATAGGPVRLAHQAGRDWRLRLQQHAAAGRCLCGWFPWWAAPRVFQACFCLQVSQAGYDSPDKMWSTSWLIRPLVADRSAKQVMTRLTKCNWLIRPLVADRSAKQVMTHPTMWSMSWLIRPLVAGRSAKQVMTHLTKCDLCHDGLDHWWLVGQPSRLWLIRPLVADVLHSVSVQHRARLCCVVRPACVCCWLCLETASVVCAWWTESDILRVIVLITSLWPSCDTPRLSFF